MAATSTPIPSDAIVVSQASVHAPIDALIVQSNLTFLNALFAGYVRPDEVSADALRSYYVDFYRTNVQGRGFASFVRLSRWEPRVVALVREGLRAMGARRHLAVVDAGARVVEQVGEAVLARHLETREPGDGGAREMFAAASSSFRHAERAEPLLRLNAAWLRAHPKLVALAPPRIDEEVARRIAAVPDRESRIADARAAEPALVKVVRALCERAGQELERITAGDPNRVHEGRVGMAWHFVTNEGHHHVVFAGGKAIMFRESSTERVCEIDVPPFAT